MKQDKCERCGIECDTILRLAYFANGIGYSSEYVCDGCYEEAD